jgi:integrase
MTPRRRVTKGRAGKKAACWRYSAGERGATVTVCERTPGGVLYAMAWDAEKGHQVYVSLHHRDRDLAKQYARDEAEKLRRGRVPIRQGFITAGQLLDLYLEHETPKKRARDAATDDARRAEFWKQQLGERTPAAHVTVAQWDAIAARRASGAIDAHGRAVPLKERRAVGPTTVAHDGKFLRAVFYWGMRWRTAHGPLLTFNPFGAPAPGVRSAFELPKNPQPKRPIVSDDRFARVRAAAERVLMQARSKDAPGARQVATRPRRFRRSDNGPIVEKPMLRWMQPSYLPEILDLVWETGRRRIAVLDLRYHDLVWKDGVVVAIRWRPVKHAEDVEEVPVSERARRAIERVLAQRPGLGALPLFPSRRDPRVPITEKTADEWLLAAERIAGVAHLDGGLWHPHRRSWATKRKHQPDVDVAKAGGWKDLKTMKTSYQQADDATLRVVVNEPARLEERKA